MQCSAMSSGYQVFYAESAVRDLEEKAGYISFTLHEPGLAEKWYVRLRRELQEDLTYFPYKYPLCSIERWAQAGVRQLVFRNDVILYSVNEAERRVYIRAVCTSGQDLSAHLNDCI